MEGAMRADKDAGRPRAWRRILPAFIVVAVLLAGYGLGLHRYLSPQAFVEHNETLLRFVSENRALAIATYVAVYIAAVAASFPGASFLTIAGGVLFGWMVGGLLTAASATIGATSIFLIARTAVGDVLKRKAGTRLAKLRDGFQDDAFNYLLFLRLVPAFPFWLVNIAPGLLGMRLWPYVAATLIGILPGTFAYSYFGDRLGAAIGDKGSIVSRELLFGLAALGVVALIPVLLKRWRKQSQPQS